MLILIVLSKWSPRVLKKVGIHDSLGFFRQVLAVRIPQTLD